jgi:hypothetical protein
LTLGNFFDKILIRDIKLMEVYNMASQECQYCYYWKGTHKDTKADCDKTGTYKRYDDDCDCGKYAKR